MKNYRLCAPADEKPLENWVTDGGYTSIFRTIACVGDSLSSGEFETLDGDTGARHFYDMFEYSWGQFMARMAGLTVYNFSRGGMTASEYCESYAAAAITPRMTGIGMVMAKSAVVVGINIVISSF